MDNDLHERSCIGFGFPRGSRLAGFQPHDQIADPHGLARFHDKIAIQPVAFVKDAERRHAFSHRRFLADDNGRGGLRRRGFNSARNRLGLIAGGRVIDLRISLPASQPGGQTPQDPERRTLHPCSGLHA